MRRILFRLVCSSVLLFSYVANGFARNKPRGTDQREVRSIEEQETKELPFTLLDDYLIVVEGRIGTKKHLKFALDTGSTFSILRAGLASAEFPRKTSRVVSLDRVLKEETAEVFDVQLGPIKFPLLPMMLSNFEYLGATGASLDALIGLDVLKSKSLTIDFAHRKVLLGRAEPLRWSAPMEVNESYVSVEVRLPDQPIRLVVDSGVPSILLYRDRVLDRMPRVHVVRTIAGSSLGGAASLDLVTLPPVTLSGRDLDRRAAMNEKSPAGLLPRTDGYLALMALHAGRCSINFERKNLSWQ